MKYLKFSGAGMSLTMLRLAKNHFYPPLISCNDENYNKCAKNTALNCTSAFHHEHVMALKILYLQVVNSSLLLSLWYVFWMHSWGLSQILLLILTQRRLFAQVRIWILKYRRFKYLLLPWWCTDGEIFCKGYVTLIYMMQWK